MRIQYENIKKYIMQHRYQICITLSFALVSVICLWNAGLQNRVRRVDDEIGYWGIAAQMAGYDWKDIMANVAYYSFGYSILLVPVLWLHRIGFSMALCYKVAILLNVVMLNATIPMALYVCEKWAPKINKYYRLLCILTITLYSNNILQSNTAWPEICIYFLYWCILALAVKVFEEGKIKDIVLLVGISIYIFTVHMRMIAVPIAVFTVLLFWHAGKAGISKKIISKKGGIIAVASSLLLLFVLLIISKVQANIYNIQEMDGRSANTFASNISNLLNFLSLNGIKDLMLGFLGKLYYQGVASYLFSYLGLGILLKTVYINLKKRKACKSSENHYTRYYLSLLIIISTIGSLMVSAIFMADTFCRGIPQNERADRVIYGRYTEFLVCVLMLIGILYLGILKKYADLICISLVCMVITSVAVQYQWDILSFYHEIFFSNGVDTIEDYFAKGVQNSTFYAAAIAMGCFCLCSFACMREKRSYQKLARTVVVIGILILFITNGVSGTQTLAKIHKNKTVGSVVELIQSVPDVPIYCVGTPNTDIKILQWELTERSIKVIEEEQLKDIKAEEAIVISSVDHAIIGKVSAYTNFLYSSGEIAVYADGSTSTGRRLFENVLEARTIVDETEGEVTLSTAVGECGYQKADGAIYYNSNLGEGFITKGTGLQLKDGIYEFVVNLEISDLSDGEIGYILATNEMETMTDVQEILKTDVNKKGKASIPVRLAVENYLEPIIKVYSYGNSEIKVTGITYKQVTSETPRNEEEQDELRRILEIIDEEYPGRDHVYYIDSDGSGVSGMPNIMSGEYSEFTEEEWNVVQLPTWSVKYLEQKKNNVFIMEKSEDYLQLAVFLDGFQNRYETKHLLLYVPQ